MTLSDALVTAVLTSPELAQARANVKVLAERAIQARSQGRIQVNGTVDLSRNFRSNLHDRLQISVAR